MTNENIHEKVRNAIESTRPDHDFEEILRLCSENRKVRKMENLQRKNKNMKKFIMPSMAAAMLVIVAGIFGYNGYMDSPYYTLGMDVNPSYGIVVSRDQEVKEVSAKNSDAVAVLEGMDLEGTKVDVALNAIIGSMLQNGYEKEDIASVLLTLEGENVSADVQEEVVEQIESFLESGNDETSVLFQNVVTSVELEQFATENNISVGKANIIQNIMASDNTLLLEDLLQLNINELSLLAEEGTRSLGDDVVEFGTAKAEDYVLKDAALEAALASLGNPELTMTDAEIEFDVEDGKMVYEIETLVNGVKYEFVVDATTGAVLKTEMDDDDIDDDDMDDDADDMDDDDIDDDADDMDDDADDMDDDDDDMDDDADDMDDDSDDHDDDVEVSQPAPESSDDSDDDDDDSDDDDDDGDDD